jgi:AraC family transcriptional regulator
MSFPRTLREGSVNWSSGESQFMRLAPGEGAYAFPRVAVGVVLTDQPRHAARYGDMKTRDVPLIPGSGWVLPAGIDGWCSWQRRQEFLNVFLDGDLLLRHGIEQPGSLRPAFGMVDPLVAQLALQIHDAPDAAPPLYRESLAAALAARIAFLAGQGAVDSDAGVDPRIRRVLSRMRDSLAEDLPLAELASLAAMSPFHFLRCFKAVTGLPPHRYLIAERMERAKALLGSTRLPIAEIAWRVGYQDVSRFTKLFRRHAGVTPGVWRGR